MKNLISLFAICFFLFAAQTVYAQSWQNRDIKGNWNFSYVAICEQGDVAKERLAQIFEGSSALVNGNDVTFAFSTEDGFTNFPFKYDWNKNSKLFKLDFSMYDDVMADYRTNLISQIYKARINAGNQLELFFVVDNPQPDANTKPTYVLTFVAQ